MTAGSARNCGCPKLGWPWLFREWIRTPRDDVDESTPAFYASSVSARYQVREDEKEGKET